MGSWDGTKIGLKVKPKQKELAKQFLKVISIETDRCFMDEEIGEISNNYNPSIEGCIEEDLLGIMPSLEKEFSDYVGQFYPDFDEDEDVKAYDDEHLPDSSVSLDALYHLLNKLFPPAYLYLAHEDGNSVTDSYYRYEVIFDPSSEKKKVYECFYSYGDGINEEQECEVNEETIDRVEFDSAIIDSLIKQAKTEGYNELAKKLALCKQ